MTEVPEPSGLSIGRVSSLLGVPVPTLRSWQARYGVPAPVRTVGGHRRYTPADVALLQAFGAAVSRGVAPRTAAQTLRRPGPDVEVPLSHLTVLLDRAVACDPEGVCTALDDAEAAMGLEQAVDRVLVPGLREIGRRWEIGEVDVGVEHITTVAVRRWIAGRPRRRVEGGVRPVVLAAAPGNRHTVALEAFELLLRRRGLPTRLLGACPCRSSPQAGRPRRGQAGIVLLAAAWSAGPAGASGPIELTGSASRPAGSAGRRRPRRRRGRTTTRT